MDSQLQDLFEPFTTAAAMHCLGTVVAGGEQVNQGRFVRLELALPAQDGLIALSHESIYGTDRIYLVDEHSRMRARQVARVGETRLDDGRVRVLVSAPDLPAGARVVTTQLPNALDGLLRSRLPRT